jgi:hypothetical protein
MCYTLWEFVLIVGDHNEGFVFALAECSYHLPYSLAVGKIQSVKRFIKNE